MNTTLDSKGTAAGWLQIRVRCNENEAQDAALLFEELGALAVTFTDAGDTPILEPQPGQTPLWPVTEVTALFDKDQDPDPILQRIRMRFGDGIPAAATDLEDRDWVRAWLEHYRPQHFGRLWVASTTSEVKAEPDESVVRLDPGLAFGTGTHPSTALCLDWLQRADLLGRRVLDYGCGSGILAISAAKLGAAGAVATDIDPQALTATSSNSQINHVSGLIKILPPDQVDGKFDICVANILAEPLTELAPVLAGTLKTGGTVLLSGILDSQAGSVCAAYSRYFAIRKIRSLDGWALLQGSLMS